MHRLRSTPESIAAKYKREGVDIPKVMESHERQKKSLHELKKLFEEKQFVSRNDLTKRIVYNKDLVISLGGDNHFQYITHFVDSELIMGINSDPLASEGALTYFTTKNFERILKKLQNDKFEVEEWTRLEAKLNGSKVERATDSYFLGEYSRIKASTHILEFRGKKERQKCAGLIVATGAGSTGWFNSACRYIHHKGKKFPKTKKCAEFLVTEAYRGKINKYSMLSGTIKKDDELIVHSLNDDKGILIADSMNAEHNFNEGAKAVIRISDKPLRVVRI